MPNIKPISDLRNYSEVLRDVAVGTPVFLTKNGRGRYAIVDMQDYERTQATIRLMNELAKIKNVAKKVIPSAPNEVLLVLDGSTGQNAFEQAKQFSQATEVNSLAITKLDGTAKGGVVIGISNMLKVPVKYIGLGEKMDDLQLFNREAFVKSLFNQP